VGVYSIDKLMAEARRLAADYRRTTGKTLPVTAEIAEHDAIRLLGLKPAPADAVGYDAMRCEGDEDTRIQIKGRVIFDENKSGQRIGQIRLNQDWDSIVLVLLDEDYESTEIYEVYREEIQDLLEELESSRRSKRGAISVARFKIIGRLVWSREHGLEDDGYWDNSGAV